MKKTRFAALCMAGAVAVSVLTGCGLDKNETIATLGEQEIPAGVANFMCRYQQSTSDDAFRGYFGDDVWSQDLYGNGSTMQETVKTQVMESLHEMYTLQNHMQEYDVSLSEEEKQKISDTAAEFINANSKDALKEMGAEQEIVEELLTLYTIRSKMYAAVTADTDTNVSDEEANMRAYSMIRMATDSHYDENYNQIAYTQEEVAQIQETAEEIAQELETNPDFDAVAKAHEYTASTGTYDADDTTLDEAVKTALDGLEEGVVAEPVVTDNAIYIVRLDSASDKEATEENRQSIIKERKDARYDEVLAGWQKDDGWEVKDKVLAKIVFRNGFTQTTETETETETESESETETETESESETETETESESEAGTEAAAE